MKQVAYASSSVCMPGYLRDRQFLSSYSVSPRARQSLSAIFLEVNRAAKVRVERTIAAELIINRTGETRISPTVSRLIPTARMSAECFSAKTKRRSLRTLVRNRLSGRPT